jgi:hypothetical protein
VPFQALAIAAVARNAGVRALQPRGSKARNNAVGGRASAGSSGHEHAPTSDGASGTAPAFFDATTTQSESESAITALQGLTRMGRKDMRANDLGGVVQTDFCAIRKHSARAWQPLSWRPRVKTPHASARPNKHHGKAVGGGWRQTVAAMRKTLQMQSLPSSQSRESERRVRVGHVRGVAPCVCIHAALRHRKAHSLVHWG